jgi:hypothetical protein
MTCSNDLLGIFKPHLKAIGKLMIDQIERAENGGNELKVKCMHSGLIFLTLTERNVLVESSSHRRVFIVDVT